MPSRKTTEDIIETITYEIPARTRSPLAPMVRSTKLAASSTSKPTYRLNRSPARKALQTPADSARYVGMKIDTGWRSSPSRIPCAAAYSTTASNTMAETTSINAESRSTTRVIPSGPSFSSVGPQPPTASAKVPLRSAR
ncbi:Uncharacterised protein [Mycobacteroides abscessus subsp. massiliense]|nr:Uncharacterised protein [Mycobacteroides abscessus subsp. massiliense]